MTVAAVVLAAGAATRYGSPKQLVFLPYVLERLAQTSVAEVVVVEGAYPIPADEFRGARVVTCPDWALGPGASLRCGLAALGDEVEAALIVLADGPQLDGRLSRYWSGCRSSASFASSSGGIGSSTATFTKRRRSSSNRYRLSQPGQAARCSHASFT